jgi:hypothetical protein
MRIRLKINTSNLARRGIAVALLAAVCCASSGVPMVRLNRKDTSRPYPCQDRPCGCASADECWHHCCCMTNKQKLAWAREHDVTPPDYVVAAAAREENDPTEVCEHKESEASACCRHEAERPCCRSRHHAEVAAADAPARKAAAKVKFVLSDMARRCGGMPPVISLLSDALPFVDRPEWKPVERLVGYLVDAPVPFASAELPPPVPPPRLAGVVAA